MRRVFRLARQGHYGGDESCCFFLDNDGILCWNN